MRPSAAPPAGHDKAENPRLRDRLVASAATGHEWMDAVDRQLLDRIQDSLPLARRPFALLAGELGLTESEVLGRLEALRERGILRQVSAIFDTRRLGYRTTLVAAVARPDGMEDAARAIGVHPGVTHCYERDHPWNLWFTLAVPPESRLGLEGTVARLAKRARCECYRLFPSIRVFKIGMKLPLEGSDALAREELPQDVTPDADAPVPLTEAEKRVVLALQEPLPLVEEPFDAAASRAGMCPEEIIGRASKLLDRRIMRRLAALLHHRPAGFGTNALAVWAVPPRRVEQVGALISSFRAVTHCSQRATYPDWPYSIFSMVHVRSRAECEELLGSIAAATGVSDCLILWTVREFKKVRLRCFTPDYEAWEAA